MSAEDVGFVLVGFLLGWLIGAIYTELLHKLKD